MTDRELLELAAKAAGIKIEGWDPDYETYVVGHPENGREGFLIEQDFGYGIWNPLKDDGDALRLAVKLNLHIQPNFSDEYWFAVAGVENPDHHQDMDPRESLWLGEAEGKADPAATTRLAIVRAAAEIGKATK